MDALYIAFIPITLILVVGVILATKKKMGEHKQESDANLQELLSKINTDNDKKEK